MQVDQVVGQLEADALVLAERLAEGLAGAGVVDGDVVAAPGGAQPAHAVGEAGGGEADLGVAEALPDRAEHLVGAHVEVLKSTTEWPPTMLESIVSSTSTSSMPGSSASQRKIVAPTSVPERSNVTGHDQGEGGALRPR